MYMLKSFNYHFISYTGCDEQMFFTHILLAPFYRVLPFDVDSSVFSLI